MNNQFHKKETKQPEPNRNETHAKKVRCWDADAARWTSERIEEAEWQPGKRVVRVHTTRYGNLTCRRY